MKKIFATVLAMMLMLTTFSLTAFAEGTTEIAEVYVTISDGNGKLVLAQEKIIVNDTDADGALTINDALYNAHEAKYEGGAAAGYAATYGAYGLSLNKLWGVANGGSYGYYVNNASAWSLTDVVESGDYINAYAFTDLTAWSDTYSYFDVNTVTATQDDEVSLTLLAAGYDANYNPVTLPVEGATITINGIATEYKTDAEGKVTVKLTEAGTCVISAVSETQTLVPPVCVATVAATETSAAPETTAEFSETTTAVEEVTTTVPETTMVQTEEAYPETGDETNAVLFVMLVLVSFAGIIVLSVKGRKSYEK